MKNSDDIHVDAARQAGLRHVDDTHAGITREAHGDGFRYRDSAGKLIHDEATLKRIAALAIPPAWRDVWICPRHNGHIQATGRDAKNRKQYRYHTLWRTVRDEAKYERMRNFGQALPAIRQQVATALTKAELSREKVLATVIALLQQTMIRIGNEEYAKTNRSFGLTTLRNRHVEVKGAEIRFHFRGKSGVDHAIHLKDRRLANIVRRIRDLPGQDLFQYVDQEGQRHAIGSAEVNDYLREISGDDYTAKDFRTWSGTLHAALELHRLPAFATAAEAKRNVNIAITQVARKLGNTPAICRKCYVHPLILDTYLAGEPLIDPKVFDQAKQPVDGIGLNREELAVLALLEKKHSKSPGKAVTER